MRVFFQFFAKKVNALNEWTGKVTAWLTAILVALVCFDVVARKLFNFSKIWIMDLEWHLFALIFLFGAGYALKHNRHVRVDLFYENFSPREKASVNFWGHLLFLIPWCGVVIYYSFGYAMESYLMNEGAAEPGGLPMRYLIKFCIPVATGMLLLQGLAGLIESGEQLFSRQSHDDISEGQNPSS